MDIERDTVSEMHVDTTTLYTYSHVGGDDGDGGEETAV